MYLHEKLEAYGKNGRYPMHMPGHKRQLHEGPYAGDITEIDGFDNLHHSEDILKHDRERAALFYGAGEARFLVNGSTCGVLAAISAVTDHGDPIIIGRNAHKSAYHAIQLRGLRAEYVYPDASFYESWSIDGPIPPEEVRRLLEQSEVSLQKPKAVFLTSPTYEGVISNIREIAGICHEYDIPLIVDEAHGAHLKVMEAYGSETGDPEERKTERNACDGEMAEDPEERKTERNACDGEMAEDPEERKTERNACDGEMAEDPEERKTERNAHDGEAAEDPVKGKASVSAVDAGADLVILGLHKTMPVLTQGALLAVSSEAIRRGRVSVKVLDQYLGIYESSSPSYVLMGSISRCIHWMEGGCDIEGRWVRECVTKYQTLLKKTRNRLSGMKQLRLFSPEGEYDPGKLVISTKGTGLAGQQLADRLRESYGIEIEMASADYIIAMTSMFDKEEGLKKFSDAVMACDEALQAELSQEEVLQEEVSQERALKKEVLQEKASQEKVMQEEAPQTERTEDPGVEGFPRAKAVMTIAEAVSLAARHPERVKEKELSLWMGEAEISTEFIYVYPPGIPIVSPGEIITKGVAKKIICDYNSGCALIGCVEREGKIAVRYITV